ncbi:MAG: filamentous hemagglutinin N-terminal domain-containing protein, partial [Gammaproteobacteria bacterium]|nr:filamentous hemagglutinin N-terminal domain-containing protein [Gammaproteobacteria bacterium]
MKIFIEQAGIVRGYRGGKPFLWHLFAAICLVAALCLASSVFAEIVFDGTLGFAGALEGPEYAIEARLGQQRKNNLFHSFQTFTLNSGERATFSGPREVTAVISRVTGGEISHINGGLRTAIPGADLYFLNPAGVMFGPNARLDIDGSFYVSSADYLRLGETGEFNATHPQQSTLSIAPPAAFGFLNEAPAGISKDHAFLEIPTGKTLSFIGGDLKFEDGQVTLRKGVTFGSYIRARSGRINLVSVASSGEVPVDPEAMADANDFEKFGAITIADTATPLESQNEKRRPVGNVDTSGPGGGRITIHAGRVMLENAYVWADTFGEENGQGISVNATESLTLNKGSRITAQIVPKDNLKATGNGGNIVVKSKQISLRGGSQINNNTWQGTFGNGGNITVSAEDTLEIFGYFPILVNGHLVKSGILSNTTTNAGGGDIVVSAGTLNIDDRGVIRADTQNAGDAGNVSVHAGVLRLSGGGQIKVSSGETGIQINTGSSGRLTVKADKSILISGDAGEGQSSGLLNNVFTTGEGGKTEVSTPALEIRENGAIQTVARGNGNAGSIVLNVDTLHVHQGGFITTDSAQGTGQAGDIDIYASRAVTLAERNEQVQANISSKTLGRGNAGNIVIQLETGKLNLQNNAEISTGTEGSGDGGTISIYADELHLADKSRLSASSQSDGNAGNLVLQTDKNLSMRDNSSLQTSTEGSDGGDIFIASSGYLRLIDSEI